MINSDNSSRPANQRIKHANTQRLLFGIMLSQGRLHGEIQGSGVYRFCRFCLEWMWLSEVGWL